MGNIVEIAGFKGEGRHRRSAGGHGPAEVIIFPGVRIDYGTQKAEENPQGPSHTPRRARRRDA